jgi:REP element-mobilizing transposase RayT
VLLDHLHAIWTLPAGDSDYSTHWRLIKTRFVREAGFVARVARQRPQSRNAASGRAAFGSIASGTTPM